MSKGIVKFFNEGKGFGFIVEKDTKNEYFVHVTALIDEIHKGDLVEFNLKEGRKGYNAVDVKILSETDWEPYIKQEPSIEKMDIETFNIKLNILIDKGTASNNEISEIIAKISKLYRLTGGSGISFVNEDASILTLNL